MCRSKMSEEKEINLPMSHGPFLMGVDVGTTGCKVSILDADRNSVYVDNEEEYKVPFMTRGPGWVEQDPKVILNKVLFTIRNTLKASRIASTAIEGVSFAGEVPSLISVDNCGNPISACMTHLDRRATAEVEWIKKNIGEDVIYRIVAKKLEPKYLAARILWLRNNQSNVYSAAHKFLQLKDYIEFQFTNEYFADYSEGSMSLLFNEKARKWSDELAEFMCIPIDKLPNVTSSSSMVGEATGSCCKRAGLRRGTPIIAGGVDDACAALGVGVVEPSVALEVTGTSTDIDVCTDQVFYDTERRTSTICHVVPEKYLINFVNQATGAILRWFRDQFGESALRNGQKLRIYPYSLMDEEAENIEPGSDKLILLPTFEGLGTTTLNPKGRGVIFGLSLRHTRAHLIRSVLEGVAYCMRDDFELLNKLNIPVREVRLAGGAAKSHVWRQIKADITGLPMTLTNIREPGAFGASIIAGLGVKIYDNAQVVKNMIKIIDIKKPRKELFDRYSQLYEIRGQVLNVLNPCFDVLYDLWT